MQKLQSVCSINFDTKQNSFKIYSITLLRTKCNMIDFYNNLIDVVQYNLQKIQNL